MCGDKRNLVMQIPVMNPLHAQMSVQTATLSCPEYQTLVWRV